MLHLMRMSFPRRSGLEWCARLIAVTGLPGTWPIIWILTAVRCGFKGGIPKNRSSAFQINYAPFWTGYLPQPDALVDSCVLVGYKSSVVRFLKVLLQLLTDTSFFGPLGSSTGQWQDLYCTSTNRYACVAPATPAGWFPPLFTYTMLSFWLLST